MTFLLPPCLTQDHQITIHRKCKDAAEGKSASGGRRAHKM